MSRPTIPAVYGPLLIGVFLNTILYGVVLVQSLTYYQTYTRDKTWIRYFVLYLFILETANTGFNIGMMYEPLILKFGLEETLFYTPKMLTLDPIVTALISTSSQFFIAWRIKVISGSKIIPFAVCALAVASLGGATTLTAFVAIKPEFPHLREYQEAIIIWLVASALSDLLITVTLSWSLTKRKTGIKATDDKIARIIRLTVHTGLLTSVMALSDAIVFLVVPDTTLNFIWDFPLAKVYAISLLSTLNARYTSAVPNAAQLSSSSSANDNNVLFGRLMQWRAASRGEGSTRPTNRPEVLELQGADSKHSFHNNRAKDGVLGIDSHGGVSVHTVVHTMTEEESRKSEQEERKRRSELV